MVDTDHASYYGEYRGPTFADGVFRVVRDDGLLASSDGAAWSTADPPFSLVGLAHDDGVYVAWGQTTIATSPDGATWTDLAVDWPAASFESLRPFHGGFVDVRWLDDGPQAAFGSAPDAYEDTLQADLEVVRFGDALVGADRSADGGVHTTEDGKTWTARTHLPHGYVSVAASPTAIVAANGCGAQRSTDGVSFTDVDVP